MKNLIKKILLQEGRVEDMKKRYPGHESVVDMFVENDPSNNNKYLQWMMKQVVKNNQEPGFVLSLTRGFHKHSKKLQKKDINQYKTLDELQQALSTLKPPKPKDELEGQYEKLYEDDVVLVVKPLTHAASCKYGSGTKWCITMRTTDQYWKQYTKKTSTFAGTNWYRTREVIKDVEQTWLDKLRGKKPEQVKKEVKEFVEEFPTNIIYFVIFKKRVKEYKWDEEVKARIPVYGKANPKHPMNKLAFVYDTDRADFGDLGWVDIHHKGRADFFDYIDARMDAAHNNLRIFDSTDHKVTLREISKEFGDDMGIIMAHIEHDFQKTRDAIINEFLPKVIDKILPLPGDEGSEDPSYWITSSNNELQKVNPNRLKPNKDGGVSWSRGERYKDGY